MALLDKLKEKMIAWLMREAPREGIPLCDFDRLTYEIRPCDVILVEGRSRVSEVIKIITQSPWSHSALYVGRLHDIENPVLRERVREFYNGPLDDQLVIESLLGRGTIVNPLSRYRDFHLRICRPKGISRRDAQHAIGFAIGRLGMEYGIRHNLDLFRFMFPYGILPRKWRSSLFEHSVGAPTKEICSSMMAEAFHSVNFPILPIVREHSEKGVTLYHRNPRLYTPSDFDYSPYFEIIKYPVFELSEHAVYRNMPWSEEGIPLNPDDVVITEPTPLTEDQPDQPGAGPTAKIIKTR